MKLYIFGSGFVKSITYYLYKRTWSTLLKWKVHTRSPYGIADFTDHSHTTRHCRHISYWILWFVLTWQVFLPTWSQTLILLSCKAPKPPRVVLTGRKSMDRQTLLNSKGWSKLIDHLPFSNGGQACDGYNVITPCFNTSSEKNTYSLICTCFATRKHTVMNLSRCAIGLIVM